MRTLLEIGCLGVAESSPTMSMSRRVPWAANRPLMAMMGAATYPSRTIPNASLTVFPDEGHFVILKHWGEIVRQLFDAPVR